MANTLNGRLTPTNNMRGALTNEGRLTGQLGGVGAAVTYASLPDKPSINNVVLVGNKTTSDLNISYNDLRDRPVIPDVGEIDERLDDLEGDITSLSGRVTTAEGDITSLGGRVTTAEGNITTLQGDTGALDTRLTTAEGNITSLGGRVTTAEGNITSLDGRVTTNEGNVSDLQDDMTQAQSDIADINLKLTSDTNWIHLGSNGNTYYCKANGLVFVRINNLSVTARTALEVGILPVGYRPTIRLDFAIVGGGYRQYSGDAYISIDGKITVYADQTSSYWGVLIFPLTEAP